MTSSRPYLIRAIYEWLIDNQLTPYIMVDATANMVRVPEKYIEDGKIVLNIQPQAIANLLMGNEVVEFDARFSGVSHHIFIPVKAVKAIYAYESGRGMVFSDEDDEGDDVPPTDTKERLSKPPKKDDKKGGERPNLKIVK